MVDNLVASQEHLPNGSLQKNALQSVLASSLNKAQVNELCPMSNDKRHHCVRSLGTCVMATSSLNQIGSVRGLKKEQFGLRCVTFWKTFNCCRGVRRN